MERGRYQTLQEGKRLIAITMLISIVFICISGCRSIYVGGSGKLGDVTGSGEVNIPVPEKKE